MNIIFPIKFFFNISKHWLMLFFAVVASFIIGWWKKRTKLFYISKQLGYFLHEGFFCIAIKVKVCMQDINHLAKKTTCSRKNNTINSIYCCYNQGKWRNNSSHIILTLKMSFKTFFFNSTFKVKWRMFIFCSWVYDRETSWNFFFKHWNFFISSLL